MVVNIRPDVSRKKAYLSYFLYAFTIVGIIIGISWFGEEVFPQHIARSSLLVLIPLLFPLRSLKFIPPVLIGISISLIAILSQVYGDINRFAVVGTMIAIVALSVFVLWVFNKFLGIELKLSD